MSPLLSGGPFIVWGGACGEQASQDPQRTKQEEGRKMQVVTRTLRTALSARGARQMGSGAHKAHVHMPETAMLTNNGTHVFERKGWEYSTYMALFGAPVILYLGITNVPETDSEVFARNEAYALRKGSEQFKVVKHVSGSIASRYTYERTEIGERPTLA